MQQEMQKTTKIKLKFYSTSKNLVSRFIRQLKYLEMVLASEEAYIIDGWKK